MDEGLQSLYNSDHRHIKIGVHMLCALASVSLHQVEYHFQELRDKLPTELNAIADYLHWQGECTPSGKRIFAGIGESISGT